MREGSRDLPRGTVTFLFTDIEGSTALLERLGTSAYADALAEHRGSLRAAFAAHGGVEVDTQGDSFFVAFPTPTGALAAAGDGQAALAGGPISVRMGIHTGTPELTGEGYVGPDVHRAARIAEAANGGQVLVSSVTAALVDGRDLHDLGVHRLRGLAASERLYQVGPGRFPPLRTEFQSNLPTPPTPFIGREAEIAAVVRLLARDDVRLLTLTGTGGTGKTRLALAAARESSGHYPDGVWWVSLDALRDPTLVSETAARTLGAGGDLAARIRDRRMLLVFDNFEQVAPAAPEIARLLSACPNLDVLVTSRAALRVAAEHEYAVPPLASADAVSLFVARARAAGALRRDDVAAVELDPAIAQICARLDDLPLAIELAAARLKVMSPAQLLARLDRRLALLTSGPRDEPERHRTLRATIEWSFDLMSASEQVLFARLAVFSGGCELRAAETICAADLDALQVLVDQSLLRRRDERFVMLETIREFASERLRDDPAVDELLARHAAFYLALAEEAEPHLFEFSAEWLDLIAADHDNIRAALDRFEETGQTQEALRLAGALQRFWIVRGHLAEGHRRLERLLDADVRPTAARGKALNGAALMAINTGDPTTARRLATEALDLHRALHDAWSEARSAFVLGYAHADERDFEGARALFEQSRAGFEKLGDAHNLLFVTSNLSWAYRELGDEPRARALDEETLRRARALGNESTVALALAGLAMAALDDGQGDEAREMLREALAIDRRLGDVRRSVDDLCRMCRVMASTGDPEDAATLLAGAERLHVEIGATVSPELARLNEGTLAMILEAMSRDQLDAALERGRAMTFEDAYRVALG